MMNKYRIVKEEIRPNEFRYFIQGGYVVTYDGLKPFARIEDGEYINWDYYSPFFSSLEDAEQYIEFLKRDKIEVIKQYEF